MRFPRLHPADPVAALPRPPESYVRPVSIHDADLAREAAVVAAGADPVALYADLADGTRRVVAVLMHPDDLHRVANMRPLA